MHIGIGLPNQVRNVAASVIPRWAADAERAGFATLATIGRYAYPGVVDTVALAAAAGATRTINLLTAVLLAPTWPAALLAKEIAGIDGVSGGRLTLGVGLGSREEEFVTPGLGLAARGKRLESDLGTYRDLWRGEGSNPVVPVGTRQVPVLIGGYSARTMSRMVRWGDGYIGGALPLNMTAPAFTEAKRAWREAGRPGKPKLVVLAYFALGNTELGWANVRHFYQQAPDHIASSVVVCTSHSTVRELIDQYTQLDVDEIIFIPGTDNLDEVSRLADAIGSDLESAALDTDTA
ncbi:LLM class flavin-dependent oxidoreductase [Mycolicibacterium baixiangningiae]|uniref:LLM class flavin-dependent oxidoreductase n=1 Tax=Mycolicibacterium baixiangningiae TaxID=2761578 RepID=UPI0018683BC6|nr:LLM class flavin-dependent oxidoreductase [Mycolicibacterium baixiangningiae]